MPEEAYDYIVALGCLEHVSSEQAFVQVLARMKQATKVGGIHCLMMNTDIQEVERDTGRALQTLIDHQRVLRHSLGMTCRISISGIQRSGQCRIIALQQLPVHLFPRLKSPHHVVEARNQA